MVWKDILVGFIVAGAAATLVPGLAIFTIIGSMGNGPLAAVLWENGVLFAGILAFLYADFVVLPSLRINAAYYGWRFSLYLAMVFAISAAGAGMVIHGIFWVLGLILEAEAGRVQELAQFKINYVFYLNIVTITVTAILIWLSWRGKKENRD